MSHTVNSEESIRSIVAESLGRLFVVYSDVLVSDYNEGFAGKDLVMKATLAKSVKYACNKQTNGLMLQMIASDLLELSKETDPTIKKNAFEGLTTIVHTNWLNVKDLIKDIESFAY